MLLFYINWVGFDTTNTRFYRTGAYEKVNFKFVGASYLIKAHVMLGSAFSIDVLNRWSL